MSQSRERLSRPSAFETSARRLENLMPIFLIERNFAQRIQLDEPSVANILDIEKEIGINWLFSFLTTDRKKTYCVYEAPSAEAIMESARRLNEPADVIVELSGILPGGITGDTLAATLPAMLSGLVQPHPPADCDDPS